MSEEKGGKLTISNICLMIGAGIFCDVLQWLFAFLFLDWFVTILAYMTFWTWFTMAGIKLLTPKRFAIQSGTLLIEIIPFVAALPAITCMVVLTILNKKLEERGISLQDMGKARAKELRAKNAGMADRVTANTTRLKPMSSDKFDEGRKKQKVELDKRSELVRKERDERYKSYEERRQKQRETEERFGGHEKYNKYLTDLKYKYGTADKKEKDLAELKYKYRNSSSSLDKNTIEDGNAA